MGEWADWNDVPAEWGDTAPTGGGGDPFSDVAQPDEAGDVASTGALPGGTDGQLSPFSPKGGFDYTDILGGGFRLASAGTFGQKVRQGASAYLDYAGRPAAALKRLLDGNVPDPGGGGGGAPGLLPMPGQNGLRAGQQAQVILHGIRMRTGMRVTQRKLVQLIVRYGFNPVAAMTGADQSGLLFLFMREKGTTHHRRGPGLWTIARKFRKYESLKRQVAHILGRGGGHRRRSKPHYNFHKRRKAKKG